MSGTFTVLYVCTGNVCRSAAAQALLRHRARPEDSLTVVSAGTHALEGYGVDAPTAAALAERGVSSDGHEGVWLTDAMIKDADLVLTATTEHRDRVLRRVPATMRRAFTMREFVRLGAHVEGAQRPEDRTEAVRAVAGMRGQVEPAGPGADDIGDPFGAGIEAARVAVAQVAETVDGTARLLGLPAGR
ncbi:arsenate reductase/protein-tyrosine-phosphatase family protein [Jatrophihabitans sp. YIM 134969]